jgi:hypothetical protein
LYYSLLYTSVVFPQPVRPDKITVPISHLFGQNEERKRKKNYSPKTKTVEETRTLSTPGIHLGNSRTSKEKRPLTTKYHVLFTILMW